MLTIREVRWNFFQLDFLARLNIMPIIVNRKTGKIEKQTKSWKLIIWKVLYGFMIAQLIFIVLRGIQSLILPKRYLNPQHFPFHGQMVVAILLPSWIATSLFVLHPAATVAIFNELYDPNEKRQPGGFRWTCYSLHDYFTIFLPFVIMNVVSVYITDFDTDPNKIFYVYSVFAEYFEEQWVQSQMFRWFEILLLLNAISWYNISDFMMLSFFSRIFASIDGQIGILRSHSVSLQALDEATKKCRNLQVLIHLFNQNFAYITFITKVVCIYGTIVCFYFTIKLVSIDMNLAVANLILALDGVGAYIIFFDKAFGIPGKMQELKTAILMASNRLHRGARETLRMKELRSVPNSGIKVGDFHTFERESTPNFVDFVSRNIIGLLITTKA